MINNNIQLICLLIFLISCKTDFIKNQSYEKIPFFLCIGQSNMAGRAVMTNNDTLVINNVFLFDFRKVICIKMSTTTMKPQYGGGQKIQKQIPTSAFRIL